MKTQLTDLTIRSLPPGTYFDTKTAAFGIRIGIHKKTWVATKGRERKIITLGHYPALSLAEARTAPKKALLAPEVAKATLDFPTAVQLYLAQGTWREGSKRVLTSNLNKFTWTLPLAKITHEDVHQAIDAIEKPSAKAHALKDIRAFFNWCIPRYLPSSPSAGLRMAPQPSRDRVLTDDELRRVWIAAEQMGDYGLYLPSVGGALPPGEYRGRITIPPSAQD